MHDWYEERYPERDYPEARASTDIDGSPILILSLSDVKELKKLLDEQDNIAYNKVVVRINQFLTEVTQ